MNTQLEQVLQVVANTADVSGRILLVEDDLAISQMLEEILAENGFTPSSATCAAKMDPILAQGGVDLILLDVMLPKEDGFSICRRVRRRRTCRSSC